MDLVIIRFGTACEVADIVGCDKGKDEGCRSLTWREDGPGDDAAAGDGEMAVPESRDEVVVGTGMTRESMMGTEEVVLSGEVRLGIGLLDWDFWNGKWFSWNSTCLE